MVAVRGRIVLAAKGKPAMRRFFFALIGCLAASTACAESLRNVKVVNDRAPDCSSLKSIVDTVTRGCKTDDERVIAIYNFCRYNHYHHAYPTEPGGISALKFINVYGWGLCGGQHAVMSALWEAAGYKWRFRGWRGHTTVEVFYGGRWHYLDTFLKFYAWMPDPQSPGGRTIADQESLKANPQWVTDALQMDAARKVLYLKDNRFDYAGDKVNWTAPAFLVCGDTISGVISGLKTSRNSGSPRGWGGMKFDDENYSTAVNLSPGYSLSLRWDKDDDAFYFRGRKQGPHHTCGDKDYRNCPAIGPILEPYNALGRPRTWSNGTLTFKPNLGNDTFLADLKQADNVALRGGALHPKEPKQPGVLAIEMASPYVVAKATGKIVSEGAKIEVSKDGQSYAAANLAELTPTVAGLYRYTIRVTFSKPITAIELTSVVQHNQEALPYLAPGRNKVTISADDSKPLGKNRLVVTYAYCLGSRSATPEDVFDRGAEIARAHYASWSSTPIVVQKTIDRLPASLEIPVPTAKGKQPVYPRMLFLRRELLAPGQKPMAVPSPPSQPKVGPGQVLATLPDPWRIGAEPPPKMAKRPTKSEIRPVLRTAYVSKTGEVYEHQFVKWLKDNSNAWILLADFDVKELPDLKSLAAARLVLYVHESHNRAPMQAAAVLLTAPFESGKPYDFAKLGKTVGSTIVQQGNGPGAPFKPPRRYEIDVTAAVRAWSRGEARHGLAVRIVPNRGVDDGWTVRFTPAKEKPVELVIERYTK